MNHRINAQVRKLPECPECDAHDCEPCTNERGDVREPHRVRERITNGELLVATRAGAKVANRLRTLQELIGVIQRKNVRTATIDEVARFGKRGANDRRSR